MSKRSRDKVWDSDDTLVLFHLGIAASCSEISSSYRRTSSYDKCMLEAFTRVLKLVLRRRLLYERFKKDVRVYLDKAWVVGALCRTP